jgi:hypothetical protein
MADNGSENGDDALALALASGRAIRDAAAGAEVGGQDGG